MALQGKLLLNGADYVPFNLYDVGVFMAFSGNCGVPNCKLAANDKMNHMESVAMQYEKITWKIHDGNIQFTDAWNERPTA